MRWSNSSAGPLVLGHRGATAHALENTCAAFERARRDGADGVELDVLRCASGEVVVFHDDTLDRVAARPGRIDELPLSALRGVELPGGERIPTLDEALDAIGPDLLVNIEIKARRPEPPRELIAAAAAIARARLGERALLSSFHPGAVELVRRLAPDVAAGLLFERGDGEPQRSLERARALRPHVLHPEHLLVTPSEVRAWKQLGYAVVTWTADHPAEVARLVFCGVDAIITSDPAATRGHVERLRAESPQ